MKKKKNLLSSHFETLLIFLINQNLKNLEPEKIKKKSENQKLSNSNFRVKFPSQWRKKKISHP